LIRFCRGEHLIDGTKGVREMIFRNSKSAAYNTMSLRKLYVLTVLTVVAAMTSSPWLCAQQSQKALTNGDVIRMVKAGVPESAIISSIQSSNCNFDLSPDALVVLHKAGVSQKILEAMMAAGRVQPGPAAPPTAVGGGRPDAVDLNPQPLPPRVKGTLGAGTNSANGHPGTSGSKDVSALFKKFKLGSPKVGPLIHNPSLSPDGQDLTLQLALKAQKQAGDIQKGQVMSSRSGGGSSQTPGATLGVAAGAAASRTVVAATATRTTTAAPSPSSSSASSRALTMNNRSVATFDPSHMCDAPNHNPTIVTMNGKLLTQAIFTNDPQYNLYTFEGCNFGVTQGQMHLFGGFRAVQVPMQIEFWSDTSIIANLTTGLTKELDQNNVKLVLALANGQQTEWINLKFSAARQKMLLASMPQTEYQPASPAAESTMSPDGSFTFGAARSFSGYAPPGTDKLVLDQLLPGFVISDVQMSLSLNPALARDPWSVNFSGKTIQVNWAVGNDGQLWQSSYDLNIWVSGPVGFTSPWKTDNP